MSCFAIRFRSIEKSFGENRIAMDLQLLFSTQSGWLRKRVRLRFIEYLPRLISIVLNRHGQIYKKCKKINYDDVIKVCTLKLLHTVTTARHG